MSRTNSRLAVILLLVCITGTVGGVILALAPAKGLDVEQVFNVIIPVGLLAFPTVGAIVVSRKAGNVIGWLFLVFGLTSGIGPAADAYAAFQPQLPGGAYGGVVAAATINSPAVMAFFVFFLLLFPDGHVPTRRWRLLARYCGVVTSLVVAYAVFVQPMLELNAAGNQLHNTNKIDNPLAIQALGPAGNAIQGPLYLALIVCVPLAAVSFVLRFRRSRGTEREQMKWFASAAVLMGTMVGLAPLAFSSRAPDWLWPLMFLVGATSVPVAAGIAILRYRLYDIDRIISRTLAYAVVTLFLAGMFAVVILVPPALIGASRAGTPSWLIAAATLVIAALFRPVRGRVQDAVDHRFNRARYDAEHTIDAFAARLRSEIDMDALRAELESVVTRSMQPSSVSLWLRDAR